MRRVTIVGAVFAVVVFVACDGTPTPTPLPSESTTTESSPAPSESGEPGEVPGGEAEFDEPDVEPTAWEQLVARIPSDRVIPKDVALEAFALTLGDIPGVEPPTASEIGVTSGTASLRWVAQNADQLADEELAAILEALRPIDQGSAFSALRVSSWSLGGASAQAGTARTPGLRAIKGALLQSEIEDGCINLVDEDGEGAAAYRPVLDQELAKLEAALHTKLGIPVYLTLGQGEEDKDSLAWASPQGDDCARSPATSCHVQLLVNKLEDATDQQIHRAVAHELTHCFQFTWMAAKEALSQPDWIVEGFADFAAEQLNPGGERKNLRRYTIKPNDPLFSRSYDAQGFFFHLFTVGGDVYGLYRDALVKKDSMASFTYLIGPSEGSFDDTWASALALDAPRGDAWYMPEVPSDASPGYGFADLVNNGRINLEAGEAATRIGHVSFRTDVVQFSVTGENHGRISWNGLDDEVISIVGGRAYCGLQGGCECPPGSSGSPPEDQLPSDGAMVSAVGTTGGTSITMAGMKLEDFCEPPRVFIGTTLAESTTIFPGVNIVITAEVTFVRDPDQDLNDGDIIYHVADGEIVWTIEGTDRVGCSYNAPTVTVPIDPEGSSFLELETTHDQVQYHGHGDVPDGPVVDVMVSCPDRSYTYGTGAEGTWFNAPEEEAFVMLGSSITGSYQYQPSEAIGTLYQWNFTRAG